MAGIANAYIELEAHDRYVDAAVAALITDGLATVPAVVLPDAQLTLVHHGAQVPEEGPSAQLTVVGLDPHGHFFPHRVHLPEDDYRVVACRDQLLGVIGVGQSRHFVVVALEFVDSTSAPTHVPNDDGLVEGAAEEQLGSGNPA